MATKLCSFTLDETAQYRLEQLNQLSPSNPGKSQILRELIDKEYVAVMRVKNAGG